MPDETTPMGQSSSQPRWLASQQDPDRCEAIIPGTEPHPVDEYQSNRCSGRKGHTGTHGADFHFWRDPPRDRPQVTFTALREASESRRVRWHQGGVAWTGADWSNEMCGEAGEAANFVKKLRRHETGVSRDGAPSVAELTRELAHELADVVITADLVAQHYGIDLGAAVAEKFNQTSEKNGFPERITPAALLEQTLDGGQR